MPPVYLDYNATHPPEIEIIQKANNIYFENFANTSGASLLSQKASFLLEKTRRKLAANLNIKPEQLLFTSCASESNTLFIQTIFRYLCLQNKKKIRALISPFEHPSVTETLMAEPSIEILPLRITKEGELDLEYLEKQLKEGKADFLCVTHTHNETGIMQPFFEIIKLLRKYPIVTLADAVQTLPKVNNLSLKHENIFQYSKEIPLFFSGSGHKLGAGFGAGLLIRPDLPFGKTMENYVFAKGGGQEFNIRAGTHNLASVLSLEMVFQKRLKDDNLIKMLASNTSFFEEKLNEKLDIKIVGSKTLRAPGVTTAIFHKVNIDFLLPALDQKNITVSTGSSCKSKAKKPSAALLSMGFSEQDASNVLRFSYGTSFNEETARTVVSEIFNVISGIS